MSRVGKVHGAAAAGLELVQAAFGVDLGTKSPSEAVYPCRTQLAMPEESGDRCAAQMLLNEARVVVGDTEEPGSAAIANCQAPPVDRTPGQLGARLSQEG